MTEERLHRLENGLSRLWDIVDSMLDCEKAIVTRIETIEKQILLDQQIAELRAEYDRLMQEDPDDYNGPY